MLFSKTDEPFIQVTVQGRSGPAIDISSSVRSAKVEDNDRLIDQATLVVDLPRKGPAYPFDWMDKVRVEMGWTSAHAILFDGFLQSVKWGDPEVEGPAAPGGEARTAVIIALDPAFKLMLSDPQPKDHVGRLSVILDTLLRGYPEIKKVSIRPPTDPLFTKARPLRQVNLHDWEFIQDLAIKYGCRAYVEYVSLGHLLSGHCFYFRPTGDLVSARLSIGGLTYCAGPRPLTEFSYSRRAEEAAAPQVSTAVDPNTGEPVTARKPSVPLSPPVTLPLTGSRPANLSPVRPTGLPSSKDLSGRLDTPDDTRKLGWFGEGKAVGNINIRAKRTVDIKGIAPHAEGSWYIYKATHIFQRGEGSEGGAYRTTFGVTR